jgi:hypothetical protein
MSLKEIKKLEMLHEQLLKHPRRISKKEKERVRNTSAFYEYCYHYCKYAGDGCRYNCSFFK